MIEESLDKSQYGFRKGSSTEAALLNLINKIQENLKMGNHVLGVFLDIQGAFDNLPHWAIKKALNKTKAKGMVSDWITNMIQNRFITLKSSSSRIRRKMPKGCPQGGVLSPFLWNLVLDDLLKSLGKDDNTQAFADDISLLSTGSTEYGIRTKATNTIKTIMKWCKANGLEISTLKTKILFWTKSRKIDIKSIKIDGIEIKTSETVKYLGVTIDNKLNWNQHITNIISKARKTYFAVKKAIGKNGDLNQNK